MKNYVFDFFKKIIVITGLLVLIVNLGISQTKKKIQNERCATMLVLEEKFKKNPQLRIKMENQRSEFNKVLKQGFRGQRENEIKGAAITIPVVFHIVMSNPSMITDQQIQSQLDTLNKSFGGKNGDSVTIPSYFKPLFAKSNLQFCLAKRTPDDETSTGITRQITTVPSFSTNDAVKHSSSNGADAWDTEKYLNVWICTLSDNILGYATFPDDGSPDEQGVVIDYKSMPGGSATNYNKGKTLVHEAGHYFNLYHIWGDDDGACSGTDYVDDTPNQANSSQACYSGIRNDNCTSTGNGIMYQNYMDYSYDICLVMYTTAQAARMEAALSIYRSGLGTSNGCTPVILENLDVSLEAIQQPERRICNPSFNPVVTIRNRGIETVTSLNIISKLDNGEAVSFTWTGSLSSLSSTIVTLNSKTVSAGQHNIIVYTENPNNAQDEDSGNDTSQINFQYNPAFMPPLSEGFEGATFPPTGWDIVNIDNSISWQKNTGVSKAGNASVFVNNHEYDNIGQKDYLRLPELQFSNEDSAFLSFDLAASVFSPLNTLDNIWDTLEVLISNDCGTSYTSVYKKWGKNLITTFSNNTNAFIPSSFEWRKDSINLGTYLKYGRLLIAFANTSGWENNIYLDNINLRTVTINPNLKEKGFLVTPNPTNGIVDVQFYPNPSALKGIQIYNSKGQKIAERLVSNNGTNNYYTFDLSRQAAGIYIVRAVFANEVKVKKVIKK